MTRRLLLLASALLLSMPVLLPGQAPHVEWRPTESGEWAEGLLHTVPGGFEVESGGSAVGTFIGSELKSPDGRGFESPDRRKFRASKVVSVLASGAAIFALGHMVMDASAVERKIERRALVVRTDS